MVKTCAALLAAMFPGTTPDNLDRGKVYEVPAAIVQAAPMTKRVAGRACAHFYGIRWKVVDGQ